MTSNNPFHVDESKPWLKPEAGWPDQVPKNIEFPRITLYEMFSRAVDRYRDQPAIWFLKEFMTYGELAEHVDRLATGFHRMGLRKGDVVAIALPSCFQYVISYYACAKLGLIPAGVNPTYKPAEVLHELKLVGAKTIIILDALYSSLINPIADQYAIDHIIVTNIVDILKPSLKKWLGKKLKKIPTGIVPSHAVSFLDLLITKAEPIKIDANTDDIATYIMTGGTTGTPKAAILSHFNCVSNAIQVGYWLLTKEPGACMVGILPLFHSFGMTTVMNTVLHSGMFMMLFPKPPDTEEALKTICEIGPVNQTYYPGAEVLFQKIADFPEIEKYPVARKLRGCISGAGPLHKHVKDRFEAATGATLVEGYGLSEASPVVSGGPLGTPVKTTGTIGLPLPGIEWKIMDMETGAKELAVGENGELVVTGPTVMQGYLGNPAETALTIREIGGKRWLYTGDIGFMDELGRVTLNDRKKQLIKVKGYSVFPTEVEQLMGSHDCVQDIAVAGLPDEKTGEAVKAWVVLKDNWQGNITPKELTEWAKKNLTHYKAPKHIDFIDEIPKSIVGKVLRRQLQESDPIYKAHHETDQE